MKKSIVLFTLFVSTLCFAQTAPQAPAKAVAVSEVETPVDGTDPSAPTNDPNMLRAQIVALLAIKADYRSHLAALIDFQRYEKTAQLVEQKRQQLQQLNKPTK